jgi:hypothetical protein
MPPKTTSKTKRTDQQRRNAQKKRIQDQRRKNASNRAKVAAAKKKGYQQVATAKSKPVQPTTAKPTRTKTALHSGSKALAKKIVTLPQTPTAALLGPNKKGWLIKPKSAPLTRQQVANRSNRAKIEAAKKKTASPKDIVRTRVRKPKQKKSYRKPAGGHYRG